MSARLVSKRIFIYFFLVLSAFLLQTGLFPFIKILSAAPNLLLIITITYGYIYGSTTGIICGVFAGLLLDLFYSGPFGFYILVFSYLGFFSGIFTNIYSNESILLPLALCFFSELVFDMIMLALRYFRVGLFDLGYSFTHLILPQLLITMLVDFLIYSLLLGANKKLDSIDQLRGQNVA